MEFSERELELNGQILLQTIVSLTGLPEDLIRGELDQIISGSGQDSKSLTLEQLREAMVGYLEGMQADFVAEDEAVISE
jgi:hypothetical protein